ncbi:MAG: class I SAM-dependent methyltransferase [Anaerolineae bacterium]|nr:class I SAM-dependent methyltransferase [Anaerolineae bacterium]
MRHKNPLIVPWLDNVLRMSQGGEPPAQVRAAEIVVLESMEDLLVYALDPAIYQNLPISAWDDSELTGVADFSGKRVIDVGAGTGRLTFAVAHLARVVYCVEPVENLRNFIRIQAQARALNNIYAVDGLITQLPFEDGFADVVMGGHVFGDLLDEEYAEMRRVARTGGTIILCPGSSVGGAEHPHRFLLAQGFSWSEFEEPGDGMKRKYWRKV